MKKRFILPASAGFLLFGSCNQETGDETGATAEEPEAPHATPRTWEPDSAELVAGKAVYLTECALCHDEGEEGAPIISSAEAWAHRLDKGEATLIDHALNGFMGEDGEMPARGGTETLSDEEVTSAVRFIIAFPR